jgi:hypothetical protein
MMFSISVEGDKHEEHESIVVPAGVLESPFMSYGFSNIRVCYPLKLPFPNSNQRSCTDHPIFPFVILALREQVSRHAAIQEPALRCADGDKACGYERIISLWILEHPRSEQSYYKVFA